MTGTIVNAVAIITGAVIGISLKRGISNSIKNTVMQGIGLAVLLVGAQMSLQGSHLLVIIISLALGGICGEVFKIEYRLEQLGIWLENKVGGNGGDVARAFVTTSLIYCVGAMAVVGAIEDGIQSNPDTLFAKSMLDGVSAIFFASTMGIGVLFSSVPVFIYQGTITLLASTVKTILNPYVINQLTATGGLLIIGIAFNILEIKKIKIGNLLPAILFVIPLAYFAQKYNWM
ncbi:hypothetical protein SAMN05660649_03106 [Desulfotomaculum arcticum]|uniref:Membrane protein YdfK n=1 Tax=Desulfotruncus arcticus DSM 17038 TaxID=1121424 RepID=A0A1I2VLV1_9FIRM|nr:DUF554 domain-containing protein [Desulfotruncus arcticus]SFG90304.1 hypothetical protein SAMN05660649_03106 [Desulfotomaculum arcticum] [Desulfotruncus arcticus DSM 17038]